MSAATINEPFFILIGPQPPCIDEMGVTNGSIDVQTQIFVSSTLNAQHDATYVQLFGPNAWVPSISNSKQYIRVDLFRQVQVTGVVVQGSKVDGWWMTTYNVDYSLDNGVYTYVNDQTGIVEVDLHKSESNIFIRAYIGYMVYRRNG